MKTTTLLKGCLIGVLISLNGCVSTSMLRDPGAMIGRPRKETHIARVLCLWEPAQGTGVDGRPGRGFAGQILFFGGREDAAVRVDGDVRIIEYDKFSPEDEDPVPLHTFTFQADAWDVHRTEGSLGHSYSVFIPYMQKHRDAVNCGLTVEFIGKDGRVVRSATTEVLLPGKESIASTSPLRRSVAQNYNRRVAGNSESIRAGMQTSNNATTDLSQKLETTTIALPRR